MRKIILTVAASIGLIGAVQAQKVTTRVVDNKGTIKWVIDSTTSVVTRAVNGITKTGDSVKLGGTLIETTTIATSATEFLRLTGLQSGSRADSVVMINNTTGQLKKMSVADLMSLFANNGLTKVGDSIQLGGNLIKPTTLTATATNTLAVQGLQTGVATDSIVTVDPTTGVLKRRAFSSIDRANNGLTKVGDTTQLGGALIKATTVTTTATNTLAVSGLQSGSTNDSVVVADPTTGVLKRISLANAVKANNGVSKSGDTVQLGGALTKATTVTTTSTNTLAVSGLQSGSTNDSVVVADPSTGVLKRISLANAVKASNGLTKSGDTVQLGGTLAKATTVTTSATNTLAVAGLQSGNLANDSIVVADNTTGALKRVSSSTLLTSGEQIFTATAGLTSYSVTNLPAQVSRVWVFRNGVKLIATTDYSVSGTTLTLIPGGTGVDAWSVLAGDKIEVQWVK